MRILLLLIIIIIIIIVIIIMTFTPSRPHASVVLQRWAATGAKRLCSALIGAAAWLCQWRFELLTHRRCISRREISFWNGEGALLSERASERANERATERLWMQMSAAHAAHVEKIVAVHPSWSEVATRSNAFADVALET
jgi:hypothetical protein